MTELCNYQGYRVSGFGMSLYCKITEYGINTDLYKCTMSFGTGMKKFCLIASYSIKQPFEIYIDRIEKKDVCIIDNKLSDFEEGTVKLVKLSIWTMKKLYPHVKKYGLKDDSQIQCDGDNSRDKLSMAYDYILKYNETWYQKKFNAELPGFISKLPKTDISGYILTQIQSAPNTLQHLVFSSFYILDEELVPIELIGDLLPEIKNYEIDYKLSKTPRDFIGRLRQTLGSKYCKNVGYWLNRYMLYLGVDIQMAHWYILDKYIEEPPNYFASKLQKSEIIGKLHGGKRKTRRNPRFGIVSANSILTESCVGFIGEK